MAERSLRATSEVWPGGSECFAWLRHYFIGIAAYLLWIAVLGISLLRVEGRRVSIQLRTPTADPKRLPVQRDQRAESADASIYQPQRTVSRARGEDVIRIFGVANGRPRRQHPKDSLNVRVAGRRFDEGRSDGSS